MVTVYRKTDKAIIEIETRTHRLAQRLRMALILVDGRKSHEALRPLIPDDADVVLQTLLETGYIEVVPLPP